MLTPAAVQPEAPVRPSRRFTLELEFVLCLSNPSYLQWLGVTYPNLMNPSTSATTTTDANNDTDAAKFARYLKYLLDYWKKPEYSQYLTHPAATIRNLELLQNEQFRKDVTRPDMVVRLSEGFSGVYVYQPPVIEPVIAVNGDAAAANQQITAPGNVDAAP